MNATNLKVAANNEPYPLTEMIARQERWFKPRIPVETGCPGEPEFVEMWRTYAIYQDHFQYGWCTRLELFMGFPGGYNIYTAQAFATFIKSFGRSNMRCFLDATLSKMDAREHFGAKPFESSNEGKMLSAWALENSRNFGVGGGRRALEAIFRGEKLSAIHFEVAEAMLRWAATEEGRVMIAHVYKQLGWSINWKVANIEIAGVELEGMKILESFDA